MLFDIFTSALIRIWFLSFVPSTTHFVEPLDHVREQLLVRTHARRLLLGTASTRVSVLVNACMDIWYIHMSNVCPRYYIHAQNHARMTRMCRCVGRQ